jgi:hypothetical protein
VNQSWGTSGVAVGHRVQADLDEADDGPALADSSVDR